MQAVLINGCQTSKCCNISQYTYNGQVDPIHIMYKVHLPTLYVYAMLHRPELLGRSVMHACVRLHTSHRKVCLYIIHYTCTNECYECVHTAEWHAVYV